MSQTDEYINQLTDMVKAHKKDMRKKQRDIEKQKKAMEMAMNEDSMTELRVHVKEVRIRQLLRVFCSRQNRNPTMIINTQKKFT